MYRLLVIDNPKTHSGYFMKVLADEGYDIKVVMSKEEYEQTISRRYDGILLPDLRIPGKETTGEEPWKNGLAILRNIGERGLPVLALGRELKRVEEEARNLGARVLIKPLPMGEILRNLGELIEVKKFGELEEAFAMAV